MTKKIKNSLWFICILPFSFLLLFSSCQDFDQDKTYYFNDATQGKDKIFRQDIIGEWIQVASFLAVSDSNYYINPEAYDRVNWLLVNNNCNINLSKEYITTYKNTDIKRIEDYGVNPNGDYSSSVEISYRNPLFEIKTLLNDERWGDIKDIFDTINKELSNTTFMRKLDFYNDSEFIIRTRELDSDENNIGYEIGGLGKYKPSYNGNIYTEIFDRGNGVYDTTQKKIFFFNKNVFAVSSLFNGSQFDNSYQSEQIVRLYIKNNKAYYDYLYGLQERYSSELAADTMPPTESAVMDSTSSIPIISIASGK